MHLKYIVRTVLNYGSLDKLLRYSLATANIDAVKEALATRVRSWNVER